METLKSKKRIRLLLSLSCGAFMIGQSYAGPTTIDYVSYKIVNVNSGKVLQPEAASVGATVRQQTFSGASAQLWKFTQGDDGEYYIVNNQTGYYLTIKGGSTSSGALAVVQPLYDPNGFYAPQRFQVMNEKSDGTCNIQNRNSSLYLDISGASTADNTPCIQWTLNGSSGAANQQWRFVATIDTQKVYQLFNMHSSKTLAPYFRCTQGEYIAQYDGWGNNTWKFKWAGGDYYYIVNAYTGHGNLYMDISGASTSTGAINLLWSFNGNDNQKWKLIKPTGEQDGTYNIQNKHSGLYLDISGASLNDGAQDIQWTPNGQDNQKWRMPEVTN